ncbi:hypothetical protein EDD18DRAFT_1388723 [Armillaria luteobubalina]|uniref:Uncharacterized protein n=1 Tax=Armillaria luteobubalina TaxID=153913 RepID=A0AA39Q5D0_9AGAR|nr:hypothetical protein EDD18DRAFT_1388723 [Armillaria luteobubalina]
MPESTSSRASSPGTPAPGHAAAIHKPTTYAHAVVAKPYREALKLRLDLNLEVEISIKAKVNGDITLSLLGCCSLAAATFVLVRAEDQENDPRRETITVTGLYTIVPGGGIIKAVEYPRNSRTTRALYELTFEQDRTSLPLRQLFTPVREGKKDNSQRW